MGNLNLSFRRGYFRLSPDNVDFSPPKNSPYQPHKVLLWGCNMYHAYDCGTFTLYDQEWRLIFIFLCRTTLADTCGLCTEHIEMDMETTERIISNPLAQKVLQGIEVTPEELSILPPTIQAAILADIENGYEQIDAMLNHIYGMTEEFMGHTLEEVKERFPDILQPIISIDDEGNEYTMDNIRPYIPAR